MRLMRGAFLCTKSIHRDNEIIQAMTKSGLTRNKRDYYRNICGSLNRFTNQTEYGDPFLDHPFTKAEIQAAILSISSSASQVSAKKKNYKIIRAPLLPRLYNDTYLAQSFVAEWKQYSSSSLNQITKSGNHLVGRLPP